MRPKDIATLQAVARIAEQLRREMAGLRNSMTDLDYASWVPTYDRLDVALTKLTPEALYPRSASRRDRTP